MRDKYKATYAVAVAYVIRLMIFMYGQLSNLIPMYLCIGSKLYVKDNLFYFFLELKLSCRITLCFFQFTTISTYYIVFLCEIKNKNA